MAHPRLHVRVALLCTLGTALGSLAIAQNAPGSPSPTTRSAAPQFNEQDLSNPDPAVRRKAILALQRMNTRPYNAAPILIKMAKDELDQEVRRQAITALGILYSTQNGKQVPPRQTETRDRAVRILGIVMDDSDAPVRMACIRALIQIGHPAAFLSGRFIGILKNTTSLQMQVVAADALMHVDPNGETTMRSLLPKSGPGAQYAIIMALSTSHTPENRAVIRPFLKSDNPTVLIAALHAVGRMRPWDEVVLNQVESLCSADSEAVRAAAIGAASLAADPERWQRVLQRAQHDRAPRVVAAVDNAKRRLATAGPVGNEPDVPEP